LQWNNDRNDFIVEKKDGGYRFFYNNKDTKTEGFRGPKVKNMLRIRKKFGQETKTWRQQQVFRSFGKVQTSIADRVKLFMVFYLFFLAILCIIFNYRRP